MTKKQEKFLALLDWLKFIALVCIVLPLCFFIFQGFSYAGLGVICFGLVLFGFNLIVLYRIQKKLDSQDKNKKK